MKSLLIKLRQNIIYIYLLNITKKKFVKILGTLKSAPNVKSYLKSVLRRGENGNEKKNQEREEEEEEKKFVCKFLYLYFLNFIEMKYMMNLCFVHLLEFIIAI